MLVLLRIESAAQWPTFNNPLSHQYVSNPAWTGGVVRPRFALTYKNQWARLTGNFSSTSISSDLLIEPQNMGVGMYIQTTSGGSLNMKQTIGGLTYAYVIPMDDINIRFGTQIYAERWRLDTDGLIFPDQIAGGSIIPTKEVFSDAPLSRLNAGTGFGLVTDKLTIGISVNRLNRTVKQWFTPETTKTNMLFNGSFIYTLWQEKTGFYESIPRQQYFWTGNVIKDGKVTQLNTGMLANFRPVTFGVFYSGLPFAKDIQRNSRVEELQMLMGYLDKSISFTYQYALSINEISLNGGIHQLSLTYFFEPIQFRKRTYGKSFKQVFSL